MKPIYRVALMVTAFALLLPLPARAEIRKGSWELSPFVGLNFFDSRQNLEDSPVFGGRLGYNFTKHFGLEGTLEFIGSGVDDKTLTGTKEGRFVSPMDNVDLTLYHIDGVYHFTPDRKFNPFVLFGFGGAHYNPSISNKDMAIFDLGVGAKYWVGHKVALRFDLKDSLVTEVFQETFSNIEATVGVTFAFGGKARPEPVPAVTEEVETKAEEKAEVPAVIVIPLAEPKAEEKVVVVAKEPKIEKKVIVLVLEDVHFEFDSSTLTQEAQEILQRDILVLKANPKSKIRIAGYTSASGTDEYNQKLSERRATAVIDYLIKEGVVAPDRLTKIGYGEANPAMFEVAPKELYSKAAKANMRVLFEITLEPENAATEVLLP